MSDNIREVCGNGMRQGCTCTVCERRRTASLDEGEVERTPTDKYSLTVQPFEPEDINYIVRFHLTLADQSPIHVLKTTIMYRKFEQELDDRLARLQEHGMIVRRIQVVQLDESGRETLITDTEGYDVFQPPIGEA